MKILLEISNILCIEPEHLLRFSSTSPHRYKVYTIPKRNGKGIRTIAHPSKELKYIQRILFKVLRKLLPVHQSAMAYKKGVGIKDNAAAHVRNSYLLKMDFNNFFPSITPELYFRIMSKKGFSFSTVDIHFLEGILFWRQIRNKGLILSIGAPTSPFISNSMMYDFDEKMCELCVGNNITYTRYADDLTFSTNDKGVLFNVPQLVREVLKEELFDIIKINNEKTIFSSKAHNRHVTGITITNESTLSIGRDRKRNISSGVHKFSLGNISNDEILSLQGMLAFASHVEPTFINRLQKKYGEDVLTKLLPRKDIKCK